MPSGSDIAGGSTRPPVSARRSCRRSSTENTIDAEAFAQSGDGAPFTVLDTARGRLATFQVRWRLAGGEVVTFPEELGEDFQEQLAKFGFFHCPDAKHRDRCVCFSCKRALHSWEKGDSPLYEHCRWSPTCAFIQSVTADNLEKVLDTSDPALDQRVPSFLPPGSPEVDETPPGLPWPKDTVIDHLLICVHGVAMKDDSLATYLATMRNNSAHVAEKYMNERPMFMAVDAIDWHHSGVSAPQDTLDQITLQTVQGLRTMANNVWLDILYYTSPKYKYAIVDAVAELLADKYDQYVATYPQFSGKMSLFCHSLGSVIAFDLLWHQKRKRGEPFDPDVRGDMESKGGKGATGDGWRWPQLPFEVENLFATGSPLAMFLTVRGDILADRWPLGSKDFAFPGGAKLLNIFHPTDPVAYRFEPLLDPKRAEAEPALVPVRGSVEVEVEELWGAEGEASRIDFALQRATGDSYSHYVSSLTFASHWCYWESRDITLFILLTIDRHSMSQDFFQTATGRSWLRNADRVLNSITADTPAEDLLKRGENFLRHVGADINQVFDEGGDAIKRVSLTGAHAWREAAGHAGPGGGDWFFEGSQREGGRNAAAGSDAQGEGVVSQRPESLGTFKSQVLDFLMRYLSKLAVPPITGVRELSPGNEVSYALGSIVLSHVTIPSQHLIVSVSGRSVTVKATRISAALKNFTWIYKQKGFPWLKDSGSADAEVEGVSLWLSFEAADPRRKGDGPVEGADGGGAAAGAGELRVSHSNRNRVKIKSLEIKLHKAKASWLYNILLNLFSARVKAAVEDSLTAVLKDKLERLAAQAPWQSGSLSGSPSPTPPNSSGTASTPPLSSGTASTPPISSSGTASTPPISSSGTASTPPISSSGTSSTPPISGTTSAPPMSAGAPAGVVEGGQLLPGYEPPALIP